MIVKSPLFSILLIIPYILSGCGGGASSSALANTNVQPTSETTELVGAGVKGPLAFADTKVFKLDTSLPDLYDKNSPIAEAITNEFAQISGITIPGEYKPPYILTIGGANAIDLNTGRPPVISTLVTVVTDRMLKNARPIYITPLTTLAFYMARLDMSYKGSPAELISHLTDRASDIYNLFSIDNNINFNIFSSPAVINAFTGTIEEQREAVYHRASLEAFAAKIHNLSNNLYDSNTIIERLAYDFQSDGVIDNSAHNVQIGGIDPNIVLKEPMSMTIPYTSYLVSETTDLMSTERTLIGTESATQFDADAITLPSSAQSNVIDTNSGHVVMAKPIDTTYSLPIDLRGETPEQTNLLIDTIKPSEANVAVLTINAFDADHKDEGVLVINGNSPLSLFGEHGVAINNGISTQISFNTPASHWNDGENTLAFLHTNTGGFIIESVSVHFISDNAATTGPSALYSRNAIAFGEHNIGSSSSFESITLTNDGDAPLSVSAIFSTDDFSQTNNCSSFMLPGSDCIINVSFSPTTSGPISGTLSIISDANNGLNELSLSGTGVTTRTTPATLTSSTPVVINGEQDVVISGLHITNPNGSCIEVKNSAANITIEDSVIGPCGKKGIDILNSNNITIRNNYIHNTVDEGIMSYQGHHVSIDSNHIENVQSGFEIWKTNIGHISFTNNFVKNVHRNHAAKNGGNVVQVAFVHAPGIIIRNNIGINTLGESDPEDLVNVYKSDGTASSPILISNNKFNGSGDSPFGGGIILSDQGGDYQIAENNVLVNPGQYGIQIGGGKHNVLRGNKIFSDDQRDFTNVGVFIWRYNDNGTGTQPGECSNNTIEFNEVTWWKGPNYKNNGLPASLNPSWNPSYGSDLLEPNCGLPAGWNTNKFDTQSSRPANLDTSIWNSQWDTSDFLSNNPKHY